MWQRLGAEISVKQKKANTVRSQWKFQGSRTKISLTIEARTWLKRGGKSLFLPCRQKKAVVTTTGLLLFFLPSQDSKKCFLLYWMLKSGKHNMKENSICRKIWCLLAGYVGMPNLHLCEIEKKPEDPWVGWDCPAASTKRETALYIKTTVRNYFLYAIWLLHSTSSEESFYSFDEDNS